MVTEKFGFSPGFIALIRVLRGSLCATFRETSDEGVLSLPGEEGDKAVWEAGSVWRCNICMESSVLQNNQQLQQILRGSMSQEYFSCCSWRCLFLQEQLHCWDLYLLFSGISECVCDPAKVQIVCWGKP